MKKNSFVAFLSVLLSILTPFALAIDIKPSERAVTARYYNGPTVSMIGTSSALFSLSPSVLQGLTKEERERTYFEYYTETARSKECLSQDLNSCLSVKRTALGVVSITATSLLPGVHYYVSYKRDNSIRCITSPCEDNSFSSMITQFTTRVDGVLSGNAFNRNLRVGMRGDDVTLLQEALVKRGHLDGEPTGYFGRKTFTALKSLQRELGLPPSGFFGPRTRELLILNTSQQNEEASFEGVIHGFRTDCFADGVCSVTIDGKEVVITVGRSQEIVGQLRGVESVGDLEKFIGKKAAVFAKKTESASYTLYGNKNYYVEVRP